MIKLPVNIEVQAETTPGISTMWKAEAQGHSINNCSIAVEFGGPSGGFSAEDFFGFAVLNNIFGVFKFICEKKSICFKTIHGKALLKVDSDPKKILKFTSIDLSITVNEASDKEIAKGILEYSINNCPVCNSIQIPKILHLTIN